MTNKKPPKPKPINFELIPLKDGDHEPEPYRILAEIRGKFHNDLEQAKIALAWRKSLKADKDGHLMLGKCVKASDLQRELAIYDFLILLNREVWMDMDFTAEKKKALLDHELCHATSVLDKFGMQKYDERGRAIWRVRKHDIEEFREVVQRHGCYKRDLELFARSLLQAPKLPLIEKMEEVAPQPISSHAFVTTPVVETECLLPVPVEPNGAQWPVVQSSGQGNDEQLLGGVPGRPQGGDKPECSPAPPLILDQPIMDSAREASTQTNGAKRKRKTTPRTGDPQQAGYPA